MSTRVPIVDVELSPLARQSGVAYVHEVELDDIPGFAVGAEVQLRDEGGALWDATVVAVEEARFGRKCRLRLAATSPPS